MRSEPEVALPLSNCHLRHQGLDRHHVPDRRSHVRWRFWPALASVNLTSKALSSLTALQSKDAGARQPEADQIDRTEPVAHAGN
jgi:hypothetical protein